MKSWLKSFTTADKRQANLLKLLHAISSTLATGPILNETLKCSKH